MWFDYHNLLLCQYLPPRYPSRTVPAGRVTVVDDGYLLDRQTNHHKERDEGPFFEPRACGRVDHVKKCQASFSFHTVFVYPAVMGIW